MNYKIIQIIPTYREIDATYYDDGHKEDFVLPIVCLALIEYEDRTREVKLMEMDEYGEVDLLAGNLKYVKCFKDK